MGAPSLPQLARSGLWAGPSFAAHRGQPVSGVGGSGRRESISTRLPPPDSLAVELHPPANEDIRNEEADDCRTAARALGAGGQGARRAPGHRPGPVCEDQHQNEESGHDRWHPEGHRGVRRRQHVGDGGRQRAPQRRRPAATAAATATGPAGGRHPPALPVDRYRRATGTTRRRPTVLPTPAEAGCPTADDAGGPRPGGASRRPADDAATSSAPVEPEDDLIEAIDRGSDGDAADPPVLPAARDSPTPPPRRAVTAAGRAASPEARQPEQPEQPQQPQQPQQPRQQPGQPQQPEQPGQPQQPGRRQRRRGQPSEQSPAPRP